MEMDEEVKIEWRDSKTFAHTALNSSMLWKKKGGKK